VYEIRANGIFVAINVRPLREAQVRLAGASHVVAGSLFPRIHLFWEKGQLMKTILTCAAAMALLGSFALGQETKPAEKSDATSRIEREISACKWIENRNEIELAKFAQTKSQNEQVKQFAAKMIKDHGEAAKDLEKWGGGRAAVSTSTEPAKEGDAPGARVEVQTKRGGTFGVDFNAADKTNPDGSVNWVAIHREMADKCLAAAKKELAEKEGVEFDKCYIGMQIGAHQKMIIADEVFSNYVSADGKAKLDKCREMATEHLNEAKTIMKSLEGKSPGEVSRRQ
jgi:predicted outer membrane protein